MNRLEVFSQHRSLLFAIAYRMLSSATDAEDMVQEAWLRWQTAEVVVQSPKAYLSRLVTHLCIDYLRSARVQREQYVGPWLPEPLITQQPANSVDQVELADSLSFAFLTLLECLSPTERAVFLLREVFDYNYADIAKIVGKSVPNCRQIFRRARQHLALRRPSVDTSLRQQEELVEQFLESWNQGDLHSLIALMAEDVTFWADGGGKVVAARKPLHGRHKVAHFLIAIQRSRVLPKLKPQIAPVNGQLGIVNYADGKPQSILSFDFWGDQIKSIFAVVNPIKLQKFTRHQGDKEMHRVHTHAQVPQTTGQTVRRWAHVYDPIVKLVSLGRERDIREMTAEMANLQPGDKVLDVGCGTGSLTTVAKARVGSTGEVYGIDASPEMVDVAQRKASRMRVDVAFQVGLIEDIPFPDHAFDVVLSSMMFHHLPGEDPKRRGFVEIYRVLKPSGRLLVVDVEPPTNPLLRVLYPVLFVHFWVGTRLKEYQTLMGNAGFTEIEVGKTRYGGLSFIRGRAGRP